MSKMKLERSFLALTLGLSLTLVLLWLLGGAPLPTAHAANINDVDTTADNLVRRTFSHLTITFYAIRFTQRFSAR